MDTTTCPICFNDTNSYVTLSCNHKIGVSCFITMINGGDYRCCICRDTFFQSSDNDISSRIDTLEENLRDFETADDDIEELRDRLNDFEKTSLAYFIMNEDNQPLLIILFLLYIILVKI